LIGSYYGQGDKTMTRQEYIKKAEAIRDKAISDMMSKSYPEVMQGLIDDAIASINKGHDDYVQGLNSRMME
jgi:hypothetical protein